MANKIVYRTEDEVRDSAKIQLGFDKIEANVKQGTGQITTFNQLFYCYCNSYCLQKICIQRYGK